MSTICKTTLSRKMHRLCNIIYNVRFTSMSTTCGGDDDKGQKDVSESGKDPCKCPCGSCPSDSNPSAPTAYDCRKDGHCLPSNTVMPCFEPLPNIPTGIFRCTVGEQRLGSGADKCSCYPCPEYFSYQHMTFYDMHMVLRGCRIPSPKTGRKP